jgi:hypothetical protein
MLVGTTLAYFVDSVGSVNNVISSGTLSVGLEYAKNDGGALTEWQTVEGSSNVFDPHTIWEPGQVEVVYLKISNVGELALKYQLFVNIFPRPPEKTPLGRALSCRIILFSGSLRWRMGLRLSPKMRRSRACRASRRG